MLEEKVDNLNETTNMLDEEVIQYKGNNYILNKISNIDTFPQYEVKINNNNINKNIEFGGEELIIIEDYSNIIIM